MTIHDIRTLRKEIEKEYSRKGYSDEQFEDALHKDPRYPKDRLVEVTGYDLEKNKVLGLLGDKKCEITISQAAFNRGEERLAQVIASGKTPGAWMGHKIDANMEKAIPVKSQLILEESVIEKNDLVISLVASRIARVAPASENSFKDIFSMKYPTMDAVSKTIKNLRDDSSADNSIKPKKS